MTAHDRPMTTAPVEARGLPGRLAAVLGDLAFPAQRWQVLTAGEMYGTDTVTRGLLERLPERRYQSLGEVVGVLAAVLSGRPVASVGQAGPPRTARVAPRRGPGAPVPPRTARAHPGARRPAPRTPVA
ncbi:hypothetical protein Acsp06_23850 [Actinomycetospora sp. NBRC 106375]|uniref:DUF2795 domain-containing protein n=1 Tax=Actinomycetospora sp. NBRC 106375 TaxID=3032207 RepID=UPI0024A27660|nr:DUF2795 domain-containing protein [Actinomycetospora sp. NBRC 106375]GLZ46200.1 hypothetical protein Acsp06_23850 [Actinomycetospora sp. NBRC 106375]